MAGRRDPRTAGLLLVGAAVVAAGTTPGMLLRVDPWMVVLDGRHRHDWGTG